MAIAADLLAIGTPSEDDSGFSAGCVYIFQNGPSGWVELQKITASEPESSDNFGSAVAFSGDTLLVGALGDNEGASNGGSVYFFQDSGYGWEETGFFIPADSDGTAFFGGRIATDGNAAFISAPNDEDKGAVYVLTNAGNDWVQIDKLRSSPAPDDAAFGAGLALHGNIAVIGSPYDAEFTGAAYVFEKIGGDWVQTKRLTASDSASGHWFGNHTAIVGDTLFVAAPFHPTGAVYRFEHNGSTWIETGTLIGSHVSAGDRFGSALASTENTVVVGANDASEAGLGAGAVYVFEDDGAWSQIAHFTASEPGSEDALGTTVAATNGIVFAQSLRDDEAAINAGAVYVFGTDCPEPTCFGDLTGDDVVNVLDLIEMLSAWGPNPGHAADLTGDDTVNVLDLLALLGVWGSCGDEP